MGGGSSQPLAPPIDDQPFKPFYRPSEQLPPTIVPFSYRNITRIEVYADTLINRTNFIFNNGTSEQYGGAEGTGGNGQEPFDMAPNEYITKIYWRQSSQLCGIQFETNLTRKSKAYLLDKESTLWQNQNTGPGRYWVHTATPGHKIMGYANRMLAGQFNCPCIHNFMEEPIESPELKQQQQQQREQQQREQQQREQALHEQRERERVIREEQQREQQQREQEERERRKREEIERERLRRQREEQQQQIIREQHLYQQLELERLERERQLREQEQREQHQREMQQRQQRQLEMQQREQNLRDQIERERQQHAQQQRERQTREMEMREQQRRVPEPVIMVQQPAVVYHPPPQQVMQQQVLPMGVPVDTTGDGIANAMGYDTTGDGHVDSLDTTGDGRIDVVLQPQAHYQPVQQQALGVPVDTTGDGIANAMGYDTTGDGHVDSLDTTGNGAVDISLHHPRI